MIKKIITFISAFVLAAQGAVCSVSAESDNITDNSRVQIGDTLDPRYTHLGSVTADIIITSTNKADCGGSYFAYEDNNINITVYLLESTDGETNWHRVEHWSKDYTTFGTHSVCGVSSSTLRNDRYYCAMTYITVYDSNGMGVEAASCYSKVRHL